MAIDIVLNIKEAISSAHVRISIVLTSDDSPPSVRPPGYIG